MIVPSLVSAGVRVQEHLQKAGAALQAVIARRQGEVRLAEHIHAEEAMAAPESTFPVQGLLWMEIAEHVQERPVRASRGRVSDVRRDRTFPLTTCCDEHDIEAAMSQLGWRVSAANQPREDVRLEQAVESSRDASLVEQNVGRLKGCPLDTAPLSVRHDDYHIGLVRVRTRRAKVLTLLEEVVRSSVSG